MTILPKKKQPKQQQQQQQQQQSSNDEQQHNDNYHGSNVVGGGTTTPPGVDYSNTISTTRLNHQWSATHRNVVGDCTVVVDKRPAPDNGSSTHGLQHSQTKRRHRIVQRNSGDQRDHQRLITAANIRSNSSSINQSNTRSSSNDQDTMIPAIAIPGCSNKIQDNNDNEQQQQQKQQPHNFDDDDQDDDDDGEEEEEKDFSGYNSGDEYQRNANNNDPSSQIDWEEKERHFERMIRKKGFNIKKMSEDGACLFRAVADQVYGDQEMHSTVRKLCMDYMEKNGDYFSQYVTENFADYIRRKRCEHIHGNHIEIQALSEMYNRPIQIYHYSSEPINIEMQKTDNEPIRLSYHRNTHYNSVVNPYKATIGVGLGLPAFKPGIAEKSLVEKALFMSEQHELEQAMLEDKIRATDWEATNEAIEEQIARESYIEWLRENERKSSRTSSSSTTTTTTKSSSVTSTLTNDESIASNNNLKSTSSSPTSPSTVSQQLSPRCYSPRCSSSSSSSTTMVTPTTFCKSPKRSKESTMKQQCLMKKSPKETATSTTTSATTDNDSFVAASTFLHELPPSLLGLNDWDVSDPLLAQVLVQSQQEYLESLKQQQQQHDANLSNDSRSSTTTTNDENLISLPSTSSKFYNDRII